MAISADDENWFLLNASPEIRTQIEGFPALHPRASRHTPIAGILLTNGDLDHILGLLSLRESQPLALYATESVRRGFVEGNVLYRTLERFPGQVTWRTLEPGRPTSLELAGGKSSGLQVVALPVPGKAPVHLERARASDPGDNVALFLEETATRRRLAYVPGAGDVSEDLLAAIDGADALFFDGTFWSSEELPSLDGRFGRAEDMAHRPLSGPEGSLTRLDAARAGRRILIHLNNTNPVLREDSPEARAVADAGWTVAFDGMEIEL